MTFLGISFIELIAGFGYLFGHVLLSKNKLSGWVVKIVGGVFWVLFLYLNENYIFMAVTITVVFTMFYGLFKWHKGVFDTRTHVDLLFEALTIIVAITMIILFLSKGSYTLGVGLESLIVLAEISGTMLLARKQILGWYAYILMSACVGLLVIYINPNPAIVLGILELASIYFYIQGIRGMHKAHLPSF